MKQHVLQTLFEDVNWKVIDAVCELLHIEEDEASEKIADLDVNDALALIDAVGKNNKDAIRKIMTTGKDETYGIGDEVVVHRHQNHDHEQKEAEDEVEGVVKIPNGPGNTMGILIDGELRMVDKKDITPKLEENSEPDTLEEGILGMTALPGLQRMKALAGLSNEPEPEPEPEPEFALPPEAPVEEVEIPPLATPAAAPAPVDQTEIACTTIMSALDTIEQNMPEIKVGSYKKIVDRLLKIQGIINESARHRKKPIDESTLKQISNSHYGRGYDDAMQGRVFEPPHNPWRDEYVSGWEQGRGDRNPSRKEREGRDSETTHSIREDEEQPKTNVEDFKNDLVRALGTYDRHQSTRRGYNPHALNLYLERAEQCAVEVAAGKRWFEVIEKGFNDRLRNFLLKRFEKLGWRR